MAFWRRPQAEATSDETLTKKRKPLARSTTIYRSSWALILSSDYSENQSENNQIERLQLWFHEPQVNQARNITFEM